MVDMPEKPTKLELKTVVGGDLLKARIHLHCYRSLAAPDWVLSMGQIELNCVITRNGNV